MSESVKTLKEARTDRKCSRCGEYEMSDDGYCNRCGETTGKPIP